MFYKICFSLALAIVVISLIGAASNASAMRFQQQNFVDSTAQRYTRVPYLVPYPSGYYGGSGGSYRGSSGSSGSSRSSYDGYRGGGPGSGK